MTTGTGNWIETEMAIEELGCAQHRVKIKMKTKAVANGAGNQDYGT